LLNNARKVAGLVLFRTSCYIGNTNGNSARVRSSLNANGEKTHYRTLSLLPHQSSGRLKWDLNASSDFVLKVTEGKQQFVELTSFF
jgi:hypothetical protein